tara:strand:- start:1583 stop:1801 length:219 start_codon:yes stop_codon:yes gene_type:complete
MSEYGSDAGSDFGSEISDIPSEPISPPIRKRKQEDDEKDMKKVKLVPDNIFFAGCIIYDYSNDKIWLKFPKK